MTEAWSEERQWDLACNTASALNSKWSSPKHLLPFSPRDFIPKSADELRAEVKTEAKSRADRDRILEMRFAAAAASLPKKGGCDGARK